MTLAQLGNGSFLVMGSF